jgi:hypothetical protein
MPAPPSALFTRPAEKGRHRTVPEKSWRVEIPTNRRRHVPFISPAQTGEADTSRNAIAILTIFIMKGVSLTDCFDSPDRTEQRHREFEEGGKVIVAGGSPAGLPLFLV